MLAPVNKILPFSNVDGPGNRCAIFFQSCPFQCVYCHNPETINMCKNCGKCVTQCPVHALSIKDDKVQWDIRTCVDCDTCIHVCPHLASPKITWMEVSQLVEEVKKVKPFIRGITVSGGECMNQAEFLLSFFKEIKALGLHILLDSNGFYDFENYPELISLCDGVMLDVKASNPSFHKTLCKADNQHVLKNLNYLADMGKLEEVRTVLLPNHDIENKETIHYVCEHIKNRCRYKLIAYRPYGVRSEGLQTIANTSLSKDELVMYADYAQSLGNVTYTLV